MMQRVVVIREDRRSVVRVAGTRGQKGDPGTTEWAGIAGKPATYPPEAHGHDYEASGAAAAAVSAHEAGDTHSIYGMAAPSAAAVAYNAGGTTTIALDNGRTEVFTATAATGSTTWAVTGLVAGKATAALLVLTNGGSQTQNWPAGSKFEGGVAPTLTAAGKDKLLLLWDGTELTIAALKDVK